MTCKHFPVVVTLAVVVAAHLTSSGRASAQSSSVPKNAAAGAPSIPRTPDGRPDLQGVWTNFDIRRLKRRATRTRRAWHHWSSGFPASASQ